MMVALWTAHAQFKSILPHVVIDPPKVNKGQRACMGSWLLLDLLSKRDLILSPSAVHCIFEV